MHNCAFWFFGGFLTCKYRAYGAKTTKKPQSGCGATFFKNHQKTWFLGFYLRCWIFKNHQKTEISAEISQLKISAESPAEVPTGFLGACREDPRISARSGVPAGPLQGGLRTLCKRARTRSCYEPGAEAPAGGCGSAPSGAFGRSGTLCRRSAGVLPGLCRREYFRGSARPLRKVCGSTHAEGLQRTASVLWRGVLSGGGGASAGACRFAGKNHQKTCRLHFL